MIPLDQKESMKMLIKNTLTLLCKNGLSFNEEFGVEALIGITVDKDEVFLVSMNEVVRKEMDITSDLALDQGVIPEEVDEGPMKKRPRVSDSAPILPVTVTTSELPSTSVQPSEEIFPEESLLGIMKEETEDEKEISDASVADDPAEDDLEYQSVAAPDDGESDFSTPVATPVTTRHRRSGRRSESSKTETVATSSEPLEELDGSDISETGEGASEKHKSRMMAYFCPDVSCDYSSSKRGNVLHHVHAIHEKKNPEHRTVCSHCRKDLKTPEALEEHKKNICNKTYECSLCKKTFKSIGGIRSHAHIHRGTFQCVYCSKSFSSRNCLFGHLAQHTGKGSFACENCGKIFRYQNNLSRHKNQCVLGRISYCNLCGKGFAGKCALNDHMAGVHVNVDRYMCMFCGDRFKWRISRIRHTQKCSKNPNAKM